MLQVLNKVILNIIGRFGPKVPESAQVLLLFLRLGGESSNVLIVLSLVILLDLFCKVHLTSVLLLLLVEVNAYFQEILLSIGAHKLTFSHQKLGRSFYVFYYPLDVFNVISLLEALWVGDNASVLGNLARVN